jgi:hypothetical protein
LVQVAVAEVEQLVEVLVELVVPLEVEAVEPVVQVV